MGLGQASRERGKMNRAAPLSVDNILRFLQVRSEGASLTELQRGLRLRKSEQRPLVGMLTKLKKRKAIVELNDGRFVLSSQKQANEKAVREADGFRATAYGQSSGGRNAITGRLILHQERDGLLQSIAALGSYRAIHFVSLSRRSA